MAAALRNYLRVTFLANKNKNLNIINPAKLGRLRYVQVGADVRF
jgi:hypothetical protein